jgi:hypothetical protein
VANWQEGLTLAPGLGLKTVGQVLAAGVRWIGREPGSGARQVMDEMLRVADAPPFVARDHQGVVEAVRSCWADTGISVRLVSEEAGLLFIDVREEAYDLCIPEASMEDPRVRALIEVIRSNSLRAMIGDLPGYDVKDTGELTNFTAYAHYLINCTPPEITVLDELADFSRGYFRYFLAECVLGQMEGGRAIILGNVLLDIRLPRILAAALIGASLSVSGAVFQSMFINPLVSPSLLGVLSGASFGAAMGMIVFNSWFMVQGSAFLFGFLAVLLSVGIATLYRGDRLLMLLLGGIINGALFTSLLSIVKLVADPYNQLPAIVFWLMGGLSMADNKTLAVASIPMGIETFYDRPLTLPQYPEHGGQRGAIDGGQCGDYPDYADLFRHPRECAHRGTGCHDLLGGADHPPPGADAGGARQQDPHSGCGAHRSRIPGGRR